MRVLPFIDGRDGSIKTASQGAAKPLVCYTVFFDWSLYCVGLCVFAVCLSANAQTVRTIGPFDVSFYNIGDPSDGVGTSDQNWTGPEIEDITSCIATWASRITNPPGRQVELHLFWKNLGSGILGQTLNPSVGNGTTSWSDTEYVWRSGVNLSASQSYDARISLSISKGINWNVGSQTPSSSQYDLRSVITHELGHTLGFDSTYQPPPADIFSSIGLSEWDKNLRDSAGNQPVAGGTGTPHNFNQVDNPVYFTGSNAEAIYGGQVPVYAPDPYQNGSSLSHLDQTLLPNALMRPAFGAGGVTRAPLPLEWAIMQDLGWTVVGIKNWTKGAGTLNWSDTANWGPSGLPDSTWNVTFSSTGLTNGDTLNMGGDRTINALTIDSSVNFTIGGGSGTLTLNSGYITRTAASSGTQTIAQPLTVSANTVIANTVWDISGSGKLTIAGSLTATNSITSITKIGTGMVVLAGTSTVPGTLNIDDGDFTLNNGGTLTVGNIAGAGGALNFDGGTLNLTGTNNLHLYGIRVGKDNTGTFTLLPGKTLTADVFLTIGRDNGGQNTFTNQGGTVNAATKIVIGTDPGSYGHYIQQSSPSDPLPITNVGTTYVGSYIGTSGGVGLLEMKSGTFTASIIEAGYTGSGTFTQSGGTVTVSGGLDIAYQAQGTYNLTGGTLLLSSLTKGTGAAVFNFGGGVMKVSTSSTSFTSNVPLTLTGINGDATIDTQSNTVTLSGALSGNGGLKKLGTGAA